MLKLPAPWFWDKVVPARRFLLAALVGAMSAAVVFVWPTAPSWQHTGLEDGHVLRFGPDNRALYTIEGLPTLIHLRPKPRLRSWDVATGELLSTVDIPFDAIAHLDFCLSSDCGTLMITDAAYREGNDPDASDYRHRRCFLYDAATGRQRGEPFCVTSVPIYPFSPDCRWLWLGKPDSMYVIETATAKISTQLQVAPTDACFAPDGSAIAVHTGTWTSTVHRSQVQIFGLPDGKERRSFDLPARDWGRIEEWVANRLNVASMHKIYSFDLTAPSISKGIEQPLLEGWSSVMPGVLHNVVGRYWAKGPGWLAYLELPRSERKSKSYEDKRDLPVIARFADPDTGKIRYVLPTFVAFPCAIAGNGERIAFTDAQGTLEVWDTHAPLRWPFALATAFGVSGAIVLLHRWAKVHWPTRKGA
jgi:hypothetical protein